MDETSSPPGSVLRWYAGGAFAAVAIGYVAARLNLLGIAPLGLLSTFVGCILGAVLGGLAVVCNVGCRTRLVFGTLVLAVITVLAEHAWLYRDFCRQWHEARATSAEVALFRPETPWSPVEYFARELTATSAAFWLFDAALIIATAIATGIIVHRYSMETRGASSAAKSLTPDP